MPKATSILPASSMLTDMEVSRKAISKMRLITNFGRSQETSPISSTWTATLLNLAWRTSSHNSETTPTTPRTVRLSLSTQELRVLERKPKVTSLSKDLEILSSMEVRWTTVAKLASRQVKL